MEKPLFTEQELRENKEYTLKKLGLTEEEFENYMDLPVRSHLDFKTNYITINRLIALKKLIVMPVSYAKKPLEVTLKVVKLLTKNLSSNPPKES